jgi:hypothetical protein
MRLFGFRDGYDESTMATGWARRWHDKIGVIARLDRAIQGGFNRSSQHFSEGGCDGEFCASRPAAGGATGGL